MAQIEALCTSQANAELQFDLEFCAQTVEGVGYQGLPGPSSAYQDLPSGFRDWMDGALNPKSQNPNPKQIPIRKMDAKRISDSGSQISMGLLPRTCQWVC